MQATIRINQARPRIYRRELLRHHARQLGTLAGEILALASLTLALVAGMMIVAGIAAVG